MSKLSTNQARLVLQAVQLERINGRAGTATGVAKVLGLRDQPSVQWSLDALVASGDLECDEADEQFQDCDWPAAPLGSYALTDWGDATLAVLSERTFEHAVELGMQAYEKTGDVRAAIVEAAVQARHLPGPLAPAGREVSLLHHSSAWSTRSGSSDVTRLARGLRSVRPVSRRRPV